MVLQNMNMYAMVAICMTTTSEKVAEMCVTRPLFFPPHSYHHFSTCMNALALWGGGRAQSKDLCLYGNVLSFLIASYGFCSHWGNNEIGF